LTTADINIVLQRCGVKVLADHDETSAFSHIKLRLPATSPSQAPSSSSSSSVGSATAAAGAMGWKDLTMSMELEWPLNLVVTNASLARYNSLFSFLLNIKRVQIDLQQAFTLCKGGSGLASEERVLKWRENDSFGGHGHHAFGAPVSSQALHLRTNMAFLVDNIQYYLMIDVLGAQYALLQSRVADSKDFEAL
jgi:gamma-tubulin complex component 4